VVKLFTSLTTDAYVENLGRPLFWRLLWRSIVIALAVTAVTLLLAYPAAYFISFKAGRFKNALLIVVSAPFFTSYLPRIFGGNADLGLRLRHDQGYAAQGPPPTTSSTAASSPRP